MNAMLNNEQDREYPEVASGIWKFNEKISPDELIKLAEEWKEADINKRYVDLHVRKCSQSQYGIGFKYILRNDKEDPHPVNYNKFFNRMRNLLRKRFAHIPYALVGWDISSFTYVII